MLYLGIFIAYPFVMSVGLSFLDAQAGRAKWSFIGWDNYSKIDAYQIVANNFRIASFGSEQEARAFADQRKQGTVTTEPSGQRFKAVLHVGGKDVPLIEMDSDSDASFNASSILQDLDWTVRGNGWHVRVEGDAPLEVDVRFAGPVERMSELTPGYTANRAVNAVPYVCAAAPGIRTTVDLPQIIPALGGRW